MSATTTRTPPCSSPPPSRRRWCWSWTATATTLEQRLCRPRQPAGAALVDRHLQLAGLVYTFVTEHLGFAGFGDEGKVMALAAFGEDTYVERFRDVVRPTPGRRLCRQHGLFQLRRLRPAAALASASSSRRSAPPARADEPLTDQHRDLAFALQAVTRGDRPPHRARPAQASSRSATSCMTGGVALNCVANAKILEHTDVRRIWVPPCASDTGAPLGSALWHYHQTLGQPAQFELTHPFYGRPTATTRCSARCRPPGCATGASPEGAAAAPGGAGPGRRQDRRLVPGPLRDGAARARQPLDPGRPAPRRDARHPQRQGQEARGLPPVRAGRAGRAVGRVLRDRPARSRS